MSSFKSSIRKGRYVLQTKALATWPDRVTALKVERHLMSTLPKPKPSTSPRIIVRKKAS